MKERKFIVDCNGISLPNDGVNAFLEIFKKNVEPVIGTTLQYSSSVGLYVEKSNPNTNTFYLKAIPLKK